MAPGICTTASASVCRQTRVRSRVGLGRSRKSLESLPRMHTYKQTQCHTASVVIYNSTIVLFNWLVIAGDAG